ncbi:MAG TPA: GspH/FimT family pseudopilin [Gemmatimonadales bacterium]|jgi:prepilin-type N-terminal cleavage/methylation domain-containing protein|nr:GspH/FimT family pseudopilin [Gemmatimonadales bacterium]
MKQGFTLPELMLVLAVAAILLGIGVTSLVRAMDQLSVDGAAAQLVAAHHRARMMAVVRGQVLTLLVDADSVRITLRTGASPLWSASGPAGSGVSLAGPDRRFTFSPEGLTLGLSNASLQLQRGSTTRTVVISRLGRVRVLR